MHDKVLNKYLRYCNIAYNIKFIQASTLQSMLRPFEHPRNCVNWEIRVSRNGQSKYFHHCQEVNFIATTQTGSESQKKEAVALAVEYRLKINAFGRQGHITERIPLLPIANALYTILIDARAMEYTSFNAWANALGYNPDGITDRLHFEQCRKTTLDLYTLFTTNEVHHLRKILKHYPLK